MALLDPMTAPDVFDLQASRKSRAQAIFREASGPLGLFSEGNADEMAQGLIAGILPGVVGRPPVRGVSNFLQAYSTMPWLRAVAQKVAQGTSSVTWHLYTATGSDGKGVRMKGLQREADPKVRRQALRGLAKAGKLREIEVHPFLDLMDSANSYMVGLSARKLMQIYIDLAGETFLIKERNGASAPVAFWPIPPHWVVETPTPKDQTYRVSFRGWTGDIPETEVLWIQDPDPFDPFGRGTGLAQSLGDELDILEYSGKFISAWFLNKARPDLLITGSNLGRADTLRLEQDWVSKNQGFWKAFKPHFINKDVKVTQLNQTFESMEIVDLSKYERDTIIQVWGVPPEILGIITNSNRATIESADYLFGRWVLVPRLEFQRAHFQERLIPEYDDRLILDYESPVLEDKEHTLNVIKAAPQAFRVDEVRQHAGYEELEDGAGQVFFVPNTGTITEVLESPPPPEPAPAPPPDEPAPPPPPDGAISPSYRTARYKWMHRKDEDGDTPIDRVAQSMQPAMRKRFLEAISTLKGKVDQAALEAALTSNSRASVQAILDLKELPELLGSTLGILGGTAVAGGEVEAKLLGNVIGVDLKFDAKNPKVLEWIEGYGFDLIQGLSAEARAGVAVIIEDAFVRGGHPREQARYIMDVVGLTERQTRAVAKFRTELELDENADPERVANRVNKYSESLLRDRALTIARTETIRAANQGQELLWEQAVRDGHLGKEGTTKEWLTTPDDRLDLKICEPIPHMEANQEVPISGLFTSGNGEQLVGPPAHPKCRCSKSLRFTE